MRVVHAEKINGTTMRNQKNTTDCRVPKKAVQNFKKKSNKIHKIHKYIGLEDGRDCNLCEVNKHTHPNLRRKTIFFCCKKYSFRENDIANLGEI